MMMNSVLGSGRRWCRQEVDLVILRKIYEICATSCLTSACMTSLHWATCEHIIQLELHWVVCVACSRTKNVQCIRRRYAGVRDIGQDGHNVPRFIRLANKQSNNERKPSEWASERQHIITIAQILGAAAAAACMQQTVSPNTRTHHAHNTTARTHMPRHNEPYHTSVAADRKGKRLQNANYNHWSNTAL